MGTLPFNRIKTLQPGQIVEHDLVNGIQDGIVLLGTTRLRAWVPFRWATASFSALPTGMGEGDVELANPGQYLAELNAPSGSLVRTVRMVGTALAGATMTATFSSRTYDATSPAQAPVPIGAAMTWTGTETETRKEVDVVGAVGEPGLELVMDDDSVNPTDISYRLWITNGGGTSRVHVLKALVDMPLTLTPP